MIDVLAIGAHPDDIEFGCGGILAKLAAQNRSIVMVDLTPGDKGTNGTPEIRHREAEEAAKLIGAKRVYLNFKDCEVFDSYAARLQLVEVLRTYKPKLVLAMAWKGEQNHPDHLACGQMARYACRYARFAKILPELEPYTPRGILHYMGPGSGVPDFLIDVSGTIDIWKKMMACHHSQMQTYNYVDALLRYSSALGAMIGKDYAQGLIKGNPVIVEDLMEISHGTRDI